MILTNQPEFIHLESESYMHANANGIYQLITYYEKLPTAKISSSTMDLKTSRFIFHRHVITGQWQLTEFDAYPWSKNIRA